MNGLDHVHLVFDKRCLTCLQNALWPIRFQELKTPIAMTAAVDTSHSTGVPPVIFAQQASIRTMPPLHVLIVPLAPTPHMMARIIATPAITRQS